MCNVTCVKDCVCLSCCSTSTVINWGHIRTINYLTTRFLVKPPGCSLPVFSAYSFAAVIVTSHRANGRLADNRIISSVHVRSYPFYVRFSSGESVPCPSISGGPFRPVGGRGNSNRTHNIWFYGDIRITSPCNLHPLTPRTGVYRVYIFSYFFAENIDCVCSLEPPHWERIANFHLTIIIFTAVKNHSILHGHVFVMKHRNLSLFIICILTFLLYVWSNGAKSGVTFVRRCFRDAMLTFSKIEPLTSQFYIVELGFTWVCSFSYFCSIKHRSRVLDWWGSSVNPKSMF